MRPEHVEERSERIGEFSDRSAQHAFSSEYARELVRESTIEGELSDVESLSTRREIEGEREPSQQSSKTTLDSRRLRLRGRGGESRILTVEAMPLAAPKMEPVEDLREGADDDGLVS